MPTNPAFVTKSTHFTRVGRARSPKSLAITGFLQDETVMGDFFVSGSFDSIALKTMYYSVQVKRHPFAIDVEYTFEDAYFQGCDKHYMTKDEAEEYLVSFEDWEQKMLVIEEFPFGVPGVMPGDRIPHSVLPPAEMGTALPLLETWIAIMQYLQLIAEIV